MKNKLYFLLTAFLLCSFGGQAQIIETIAGGGIYGYINDTAATACGLANPYGITVDNMGNIYFADRNNNFILKVNTSGIITTVAGTGFGGYSGDGGNATDAEIRTPFGVAVDEAGNIYFTDRENERIRKINTAGIITTIAGNGSTGYSGDGLPATNAELNTPIGIAVDASGNIYFSDAYNNCIRKVNTSGIITTIAGTSTEGYTGNGGQATDAELDNPYGIALDNAGNIYITEWFSNTVRKINTSGIISTIAGNDTLGYSGDGAAATLAEFNRPVGVAVDAEGNIYIADGYNERIRQINASGNINTIAGDGTPGFFGDGGLATLAEIEPADICLDKSGSIYIADLGNNRIRYIQNTVFVNPLNKNTEGINIYPNPCTGNFTVKILSGIDEQAQIVITDIIGNKIKEIQAITNQSFVVQLDAQVGVYILNAITDHAKLSRKIIINHCC